MGKYIGKRLLMLIPVIIGVSFLIYFIMDLAPGDVISQLAPDNATTEQIEALRAQYGYDRSVFYRYAIYMQGLFRGNLGVSFLTGQPVWEMYMQRLPATLSLTLGAIIVSIAISLPLGIFSAIHNGSLGDNAAMVLALLGLSMPRRSVP